MTSEYELFQQFKRSIAKNLEADMIRGHFHDIATTAAPESKPEPLTWETFVKAYEKAKKLPTAPASAPVDLPDFLRLRLYYRMSKFIPVKNDDSESLYYKINAGVMYGAEHPTFVFHPDNEAEFIRAAEAAGAFAVDLAKLQRGEVDEYGRPIEKGGESLVGQGG